MKNVSWLVLSIILLGTGCSAPHTPTPNPHSPEDAIKAMQQLAGLPELPVQFAGMTTMANSPSGDLQVASYRDSQGRLFSVDEVSDQVVEVDGRAVMPNPATKTPVLSEPELKAEAEKIVRAATPNFDKVSSGLDYTEGTKGDLYFYDWRSKDKGQGMMPPFVQVGLNIGGEVVAYVNTVILPQ